MKRIVSASNSTLKTFLKLTSVRGIKKHGLALVSGLKNLNEIMRNFPEKCVSIISSSHNYNDLLVSADLTHYVLTPELFRQVDIHGTSHSILLVRVEPFPVWDQEVWAPGCTLCVPFQDPTNVGAVIRSAAAFGVSRVVILKEAAHPFHPRSVQAAGSALFRVHFCEGPSINELGDAQVPVVTLSPDGQDVSSFEFPPKFCLVPGMEGPGLPERLKHCTVLGIPMEPGVESLNAASATGIALYIWRSRSRK